MGFLDKYSFPNNAIYNVVNKEGGGECAGSADIQIEKTEGDKANEMTWQWYREVDTVKAG